jgi:hypothetical protein
MKMKVQMFRGPEDRIAISLVRRAQQQPAGTTRSSQAERSKQGTLKIARPFVYVSTDAGHRAWYPVSAPLAAMTGATKIHLVRSNAASAERKVFGHESQTTTSCNSRI